MESVGFRVCIGFRVVVTLFCWCSRVLWIIWMFRFRAYTADSVVLLVKGGRVLCRVAGLVSVGT